MDSTADARSRAKRTLLALESVISEVESNEDVRVDRNGDNMTARKLPKILDDGRYGISVLLLRFYFVGCKYDSIIARHRKVRSRKFACVSYCRTLTLTDKVRKDFAVFDEYG